MRALSSTQKQKVVQRAINTGVLAQESEAHQAAASRYATSKTLLQAGRPKTSAQSRFQSTWFMCTYHHDDWGLRRDRRCLPRATSFDRRSDSVGEAARTCPQIVGTSVLPEGVDVADTSVGSHQHVSRSVPADLG
jgi:hypothetical protein